MKYLKRLFCLGFLKSGFREFTFKNKIKNKIVFALLCLFILTFIFIFISSFARASANTNIQESVNLTVNKVGKNNIQAKWEIPSDIDVKTAELILNNNFSRRVYVKGDISGTEKNWTFNNVSAGIYTAQICFNGSDCNSASSDENLPVNIYIEAVKNLQFNDIDELPVDCQDQINWIANYGITTGYQNGGYYPNRKVSREQMASFIYRLAGKPSVDNIKNPFTDLANNEHEASVLWAVSRGVIQGYDCTAKGKPYKACVKGGTKIFQGGKTISRSQLALEIFRYAGSPFISDSVREKFLSKISDIGGLGNQEKKDAVIWLLEESIISGYEDGKYRPYNTVSRSQMAKFMKYSSQDLVVVPFLQAEISNPTNFLNINLARKNITKIQFSNYLPSCKSPIDVSYGATKEILACVNVNTNEVVIGQIGGVLANPKNNQYLFSNFSKTNLSTLDIEYFNTGFTKSTAFMFYNSGKINIINYPKNFVNTSKDLSSMYEKAMLPADLNFPKFTSLDISNMTNMFKEAILQDDLTWFDFDYLNKLNADKTDMFKNLSWKKYYIWVEDFDTQSFLTSNTGALTTNIRIRSQVFLPKENEKPATFLNTNLQRSQITKISFINTLPTCDNPLNISPYKWSKILICANAGELIIGQSGGVIANEDSQYLFANLNSANGVVLDLKYLNTSQSRSFTGMFGKSRISSLLSWPEGFGQGNVYMNQMFSETVLTSSPALPNDFGSKAEYLSYMFDGATIPQDFVLPANFGISARDLHGIFRKVKLPVSFTLPANFGQITGDMGGMFKEATIPHGFVFPENFGQNTYTTLEMFQNAILSDDFSLPANFAQTSENTSYMFYGTTLPKGIVFPEKFAEKTEYMKYMFYSANFSGSATFQGDFAKTVRDASYMFANAKLNGDINWARANFAGKTSLARKAMFENTNWNNSFIWVANAGTQAILSDSTGAAANNFKIVVLRKEAKRNSGA
ncbi:MAG: S-layer homology domain-containing protein [Bifidobacteriaceae bacterium]|jgi:hypothetical protein|nr:S-layer homology domain-containing protein [Bifidobacteriaceae bacterium]